MSSSRPGGLSASASGQAAGDAKPVRPIAGRRGCRGPCVFGPWTRPGRAAGFLLGTGCGAASSHGPLLRDDSKRSNPWPGPRQWLAMGQSSATHRRVYPPGLRTAFQPRPCPLHRRPLGPEHIGPWTRRRPPKAGLSRPAFSRFFPQTGGNVLSGTTSPFLRLQPGLPFLPAGIGEGGPKDPPFQVFRLQQICPNFQTGQFRQGVMGARHPRAVTARTVPRGLGPAFAAGKQARATHPGGSSGDGTPWSPPPRPRIFWPASETPRGRRRRRR